MECDLAKAEMKKALGKIGIVEDEAKEAKLELMHAKKGFEDKVAKARAQGDVNLYFNCMHRARPYAKFMF